MAIPLKYNLRHLRVRWRSTLGTVAGLALVVGVFVLVMALARGLKATFLASGDARNLLVIRKGALAESSSQITAEEVRRLKYFEEIARAPGARADEPLASAEVIILITMQRPGGGKAHVQVRGLGSMGRQLRPEVRLVEGRMFTPGRRECIVSTTLARRFPECRLGGRFRSGKHEWTVTGLFDVRKTAYDSEIWIDADEGRDAFNRSFYSSLVLRPADGATEKLARRIESDKSVRLRAVAESDYYREQTKTALPVQVFGAALAAIMSVGAVFAAMNTLYASVAARGREIGTLRVLGFRRRSIYLSFLLESVALAAVGGVAGCVLALPMNGLATGTFNWATFAEVAFEFRITPGLLAAGMGFALVMGLAGGLLPARWAARRPVLDALREGWS
jgi:putative ABC transport system permease protein